MENLSTIAQISTPLGSGGISVIRLSGSNSLKIAKSIFEFCKKPFEILPRYMYLGKINYDGITEKCLMVYFKAPYSYTGEEVVEFQCHGGERLTQKILEACLNAGATLAQNGEFTQRAFINGKISLDEAEGIIDTINATSDAELKANSKLLKGELFAKVTAMQESIKDAIVNLEVAIDYPEHDDEALGANNLKQVAINVKEQLNQLLQTAGDGKIIKSGINVAIVGKPNAGKSSLLNALIGEDRAIVTSVKGTTRDTIQETIIHNGLKINFIDTAGIHESADEVEKIGIEKSKESIKGANIVLAVVDAHTGITEEDEQILKLLKDSKVIYIINKTDIAKNTTGLKGIEISALNKTNINEIKDQIISLAVSKKIDFSALIITNQRHILALSEAKQKAEQIIDECDNQTIDILDMLAKDLWQTLGKVTGQTENEDIISGIFAKFCLGK